MVAYDLSEWSELFVATAGASAALAGLVFVAILINITRILEYKGLPERGLETALLLLGVLVVSVIGLVLGSRDGEGDRDGAAGRRRRRQRLGPPGRDPALKIGRMGGCAGPTNAATQFSPATSATSPAARSRS